ncbi:ylmG protein [Salix suchowensis]|nr:ylmG protein [Salix suchowensis]
MATMLSSQTGAVLRAPFLPSTLNSPAALLSPPPPSGSPLPQSTQIPAESQPLLTGSTRTVATILTLALSLSRILVASIQKSVLSLNVFPTPDQLMAVRALQSNLGHSLGPLFFAALKDRPTGGVLMVRVLLSWFPNIPWDRQPLSAIRDLCDPYLNLFRNIIPPIFDTLDVSPLLAFAVLGTLGSILNSSRGMY